MKLPRRTLLTIVPCLPAAVFTVAVALAGPTNADDAPFPPAGVTENSPFAPSTGPWKTGAFQQPVIVAQAAPPAAVASKSAPAADGPARKADRPGGASETVDAPWYGRNNIHKYLGIGSIGAAAVSIIAPKKEGGAHEQFAKGAAVLGGAAVATGIYAHSSDIEFAWSDPDTKHAIFGALGVVGFAVAVAKGGEGGHAGAGALGALSMIAAIKYTW